AAAECPSPSDSARVCAMGTPHPPAVDFPPMNVVICGAGEVGRHAAEVLARGANNVTVVDLSPQKLAVLDEVLDVRSLLGNGTQADVLIEAGCRSADLFIA